MRRHHHLIVTIAAIVSAAAAAQPAKNPQPAPEAGSADKPIKGIWCGYKKNGDPIVGRTAADVTGAGATPAPCPADAVVGPSKGATVKVDQNPQ